jgi:hypothetical protein
MATTARGGWGRGAGRGGAPDRARVRRTHAGEGRRAGEGELEKAAGLDRGG